MPKKSTKPRKRANGEGTIYQRPDGLWRGVITLGYTDEGKRIEKTVSSKDRDVVMRKMAELRQKHYTEGIIIPGDVTVSEWLDVWLREYKKNTVKVPTYQMYDYSCLRIKKEFGDRKLKDITPEQVQRYYNKLHNLEYSSSTIDKTHLTLTQAYDQAVKNRMLEQNPCLSAKLPKSEKKEKVRVLTREEQELFVKECTLYKHGDFFVFLLNTGLRLGEGLGLKWEDVDFKSPQINVKETRQQVKNYDEDNPKTKTVTHVGTPKSEAGSRMVPLTPEALRIMKERFTQKANDYVFCSKGGTLLAPRNVRRTIKAIKAKMEKDLSSSSDSPMEIKKITPHTLRHTFATRMLEAGVNPKIVSEILGHASVQITLDIYSHVLPSTKVEAIKAMEMMDKSLE